MRRSIPKKELHKIAKTIQWHYKSNLASNFKAAFSYTSKITGYNEEAKYKLRMAIEDSLTPSNKLHDPKETVSLLNSLGYNGDYNEYRYISFLACFKLPSLKTITSDLNALMNDL